MAAQTEASLRDGMRTWDLPEHCRDGLLAYILHGQRTGSFLESVLKCDLKAACAYADWDNRYRLFDYVCFLVNYAPAGCWGDVESVGDWLAHKGLEGLAP